MAEEMAPEKSNPQAQPGPTGHGHRDRDSAGGVDVVDVKALMAEVAAEVERKREAGLYPPEVLVELEIPQGDGPGGGRHPGDALHRAIGDMRRTTRFSARVTTASSKPLVAPLVSQARRLLRGSLTWYMNGILHQVHGFADNVVRAVGLLSEHTTSVEARVDTLGAEVERLSQWATAVDDQRVADRLSRLDRAVRDLRTKLEAASARSPEAPAVDTASTAKVATSDGAGAPMGADPARSWSWAAESSFDYLEFENRFRGDPQAIADRQRFYVDLFRGATQPVVDVGCGRGEFLGLLREADIPAYGIDRHPDMAALCRDKGFDVVEADSLEHLAAAEKGSLGGIFCAQMIEHLTISDVPRFFELAADALAPGAPLVVETINPESLFVFAHAFYVDLGHLRPLHPLTLEFLAQTAGFAEVKVEYLSPPPPDFRPQLLPAAEEEPLATLVASVDENFRRIDDILFGPQDYAVVAHR